MDINETLSAPNRPPLSAQDVIDRSGVAHVIVLLRIRMGFPAETFSLAVQPLIDGFAAFVKLESVAGSARYGGPGGQLRRGLVTALRALDRRRGQILPRNAPPEGLGALAHRWSYAVFAAALLRDVSAGKTDLALLIFERWVPPSILAWLAEHPPLIEELRGVLAGRADASSAIAQLVGRAATGDRPVAGATATSVPIESDHSPPGMDAAAGRSAPAADEPEFLEDVAPPAPERPQRFLQWLRQGIADGTLPVNTHGALVHGVEEGLLLASPGIFRAFIRHEGVSNGESGAADKRLQREVLRARWHLRTEGGVNLHGYTWKREARAPAQIHGIVLLDPQRFVDPVPAINTELVRAERTARNTA
jgi:hypothetical protein